MIFMWYGRINPQIALATVLLSAVGSGIFEGSTLLHRGLRSFVPKIRVLSMALSSTRWQVLPFPFLASEKNFAAIFLLRMQD